jgi:hypothetical protein|tara:strand:+ start:27 stop:215 length:189 start_codon:yes stop_codon:yes gene_type:complete
MNAIDRKAAYADAHKTEGVMIETAYRTLPHSSDALATALAKANTYAMARMDHIDSLFEMDTA